MRLPDDPRARRVLEEYLERYERGGVSRALEAENLDFRGAVLDGVKLHSAALHGAQLDGVSLRHTNLDAARLWGASLRGADLTGALIVKAEFDGSDATGAIFDDLVYTSRAEFDDTCLRGARFRRTRLAEVSFMRADLSGADFAQARLLLTDFLRAHLHGASFEGASGSIYDVGAYVEDGPDAPLLSPEDLAKWMMAAGATDVTVFYSPLLQSPPADD